MDINFDWTILEKVGIAGICLAVIIVGYKVFTVFIQQWQNSTDAVNKNTSAFTELSKVFERANEREIEWQDKAMDLLKETNKKVKDIHERVV
jgi:predicted PurR-regulated permease PerM